MAHLSSCGFRTAVTTYYRGEESEWWGEAERSSRASEQGDGRKAGVERDANLLGQGICRERGGGLGVGSKMKR